MRLRTLRARSLPEAMRQLRAELGEDVIIIASRETADGVEVTAAEEHGEEGLTALLAPAAAGSVQAEVAAALGFHGVPPAVRGVLEGEVARAQAGDAQGSLADALARQVRFEPLGRPTGHAVALVGPRVRARRRSSPASPPPHASPEDPPSCFAATRPAPAGSSSCAPS